MSRSIARRSRCPLPCRRSFTSDWPARWCSAFTRNRLLNGPSPQRSCFPTLRLLLLLRRSCFRLADSRTFLATLYSPFVFVYLSDESAITWQGRGFCYLDVSVGSGRP